MITGRDINPKRHLYYIGGLILGILKESQQGSFSSAELFYKLQDKEKTTFNLFSLSLDWLFLTGAIKFEEREIRRCF